MAAVSVFPAVLPVVYTALVGDAPLGALLSSAAAVYQVAPPGAAVPYVLLSGGSELPFDRMGRTFGSEFTILVRVVTAYGGESQGDTIVSRIREILDGAGLVVAGFASVLLRLDAVVDAYEDTAAGVRYQIRPMTFRGWAE